MFHRAGALKASRVLVACKPEGTTTLNVKGIRPNPSLIIVLFPVPAVTPKIPTASTNTQAEDQMSKSGYGWIASSHSPMWIARRPGYLWRWRISRGPRSSSGGGAHAGHGSGGSWRSGGRRI